MKYNLLRYSLSVWLTSVVLAPLIFLFILFGEDVVSRTPIDQSSGLGLVIYPIFVLAELLFSFITWIIFNEIIRVMIIFSIKPQLRTWLIFIAGILLTAGTCIIILLKLGMLNDAESNGGLYLALCNCACIGWGTMYFKLRPVTE